ncbi:MAG: hypothetical protein ABI743_14235 [bacterium]
MSKVPAAAEPTLPRATASLAAQLARALGERRWARGRPRRSALIIRLHTTLNEEIAELKSTLATLRHQQAALAEVRQYLEGTGTPVARSAGRPSRRPRRPESRGTIVFNTLKSLGGVQRAETIVEVIHHRYPTLGGPTYRTQVYQLLGTDPRIERVGRGLYQIRASEGPTDSMNPVPEPAHPVP